MCVLELGRRCCSLRTWERTSAGPAVLWVLARCAWELAIGCRYGAWALVPLQGASAVRLGAGRPRLAFGNLRTGCGCCTRLRACVLPCARQLECWCSCWVHLQFGLDAGRCYVCMEGWVLVLQGAGAVLWLGAWVPLLCALGCWWCVMAYYWEFYFKYVMN